MSKQHAVRDFTAYIALSERGYPAPFLGFAFTRSALRKAYADRFGHDFETGGYRALKVTISPAGTPR